MLQLHSVVELVLHNGIINQGLIGSSIVVNAPAEDVADNVVKLFIAMGEELRPFVKGWC